MFNEGTIFRGNISVISFILHKSILLNLYDHGDVFYKIYIETEVKKNYIDDDGKGVRPRSKYSKKPDKNLEDMVVTISDSYPQILI